MNREEEAVDFTLHTLEDFFQGQEVTIEELITVVEPAYYNLTQHTFLDEQKGDELHKQWAFLANQQLDKQKIEYYQKLSKKIEHFLINYKTPL